MRFVFNIVIAFPCGPPAGGGVDVRGRSSEVTRGKCQFRLLSASVMEVSNRVMALLMRAPHNGPNLNAPINTYLNMSPDF